MARHRLSSRVAGQRKLKRKNEIPKSSAHYLNPPEPLIYGWFVVHELAHSARERAQQELHQLCQAYGGGTITSLELGLRLF